MTNRSKGHLNKVTNLKSTKHTGGQANLPQHAISMVDHAESRKVISRINVFPWKLKLFWRLERKFLNQFLLKNHNRFQKIRVYFLSFFASLKFPHCSVQWPVVSLSSRSIAMYGWTFDRKCLCKDPISSNAYITSNSIWKYVCIFLDTCLYISCNI